MKGFIIYRKVAAKASSSFALIVHAPPPPHLCWDDAQGPHECLDTQWVTIWNIQLGVSLLQLAKVSLDKSKMYPGQDITSFLQAQF